MYTVVFAGKSTWEQLLVVFLLCYTLCIKSDCESNLEQRLVLESKNIVVQE